jgi:DsbC/DsbD-like thiol-disulfide interchange protein
MKRALRLFLYLTALLAGGTPPVFAQDKAGVIWDYKAVPLSKTEVNLLVTASLAPGWHIYSQHLAEGGPPPTRITYLEHRSYRPLGEPKETGNKASFYSDIFEMPIEWYSHTVTFSQRVHLYEPVTAIQGMIEYMTCNDEVCVPARKEFTIDINLLKQRQ